MKYYTIFFRIGEKDWFVWDCLKNKKEAERIARSMMKSKLYGITKTKVIACYLED